jgi:hypothetical protein
VARFAFAQQQRKATFALATSPAVSGAASCALPLSSTPHVSWEFAIAAFRPLSLTDRALLCSRHPARHGMTLLLLLLLLLAASDL